MVEPDRPHDNIIWRMRVACWITKATVRRSEYAILTAFPRQQWLLERPSMLRLYVQCLSCYNRDGVFTARYDLNLEHSLG